ncbi:MAG TPA: P-II family nitrogen regulator [Gemmatimonadaceae bacterium]|nr:P-II family nitrogen regulator [Gemmatimonadaceae bacterium]
MVRTGTGGGGTVMREVKALIRPQRVEHVVAALHDIAGLPGVTVSPVHAYSGSRPSGSATAPASVEADFIKLETVVPEEIVETVVVTIARAAHTGRDGDGIVFVVPVDQFVRIRDISGADSRAL